MIRMPTTIKRIARLLAAIAGILAIAMTVMTVMTATIRRTNPGATVTLALIAIVGIIPMAIVARLMAIVARLMAIAARLMAIVALPPPNPVSIGTLIPTTNGATTMNGSNPISLTSNPPF
jgi:NADH:ubiquinone oxidoreductase subunit 2 (subunit N)